MTLYPGAAWDEMSTGWPAGLTSKIRDLGDGQLQAREHLWSERGAGAGEVDQRH